MRAPLHRRSTAVARLPEEAPDLIFAGVERRGWQPWNAARPERNLAAFASAPPEFCVVIEPGRPKAHPIGRPRKVQHSARGCSILLVLTDRPTEDDSLLGIFCRAVDGVGAECDRLDTD